MTSEFLKSPAVSGTNGNTLYCVLYVISLLQYSVWIPHSFEVVELDMVLITPKPNYCPLVEEKQLTTRDGSF